MDYFPYLLSAIFITLLALNYLSFESKKTAIQLVSEMGIGYNLGNTYNCCIVSEEDNTKNEQINNWGTILSTKKLINQIKKFGFKTIRFQVLYNNLIYESENIKSIWIKELKKVIDWIYNLNTYCILSIYHNDDFWTEEIKAIDKYINFWKEIANEFKNYDDYLILESNHKLYFINITLLNVSQSFVDVIRNSGGLNTKRLLVIPKISTELEMYQMISDQLPSDPPNKTAISLRYYFPSQYGDYYLINEDEIIWYDHTGRMLVTTP